MGRKENDSNDSSSGALDLGRSWILDRLQAPRNVGFHQVILSVAQVLDAGSSPLSGKPVCQGTSRRSDVSNLSAREVEIWVWINTY